MWTRPLAVIAGALALSVAAPASSEPQHGATAITCTNPVSGYNWQIQVDYDNSTVDSHAARISTSEIFWRTGDGENYTLDRKSGNLTVVVASSTGGYFLNDRCKVD